MYMYDTETKHVYVSRSVFMESARMTIVWRVQNTFQAEACQDGLHVDYLLAQLLSGHNIKICA